MAKKHAETADVASADAPRGDSVTLKYVGPHGAESPRYGALEPGRSYQESDAEFASYLTTQHPDHWVYA
jgi:hypothetical protein